MIQKLDYRCRAIGCTQGNHCRRFLTGDAAKNSAVPFAAYDTRRDTIDCDGFMPRVMAPIRSSDAIADLVATSATLGGYDSEGGAHD